MVPGEQGEDQELLPQRRSELDLEDFLSASANFPVHCASLKTISRLYDAVKCSFLNGGVPF